MSGKSYELALWCLKVNAEAMERKLLIEYLDRREAFPNDQSRAFLLLMLLLNKT